MSFKDQYADHVNKAIHTSSISVGELFDRAVETDSSLTAAYYNKANFLYKLGRFEEATAAHYENIRMSGGTLSKLMSQAASSLALTDSVLIRASGSSKASLCYQAIYFLDQAIEKAEKENAHKLTCAVIHFAAGNAWCELWNLYLSRSLPDYETLEHAHEEFKKCLKNADSHTEVEHALRQVNIILRNRRWGETVPRWFFLALGILLSIPVVWSWFSRSVRRKLMPMQFLTYFLTAAGFLALFILWSQISKVKFAGIELERTPISYQYIEKEPSQLISQAMKVYESE